MVDGERIDGAWCHIWRRDQMGRGYYLDDLTVFADGLITCGERTDLDGLAKKLETGRWAVTDPEIPPPPAPPSKWEARYSEPLTAEGFVLEVADRIEALSGRPTAGQRCWDAIRQHEQQPTEPNRELLRAAYLAVPAHLRVFVLGDMDLQDRPLRILLTDIGEAVGGDGPVATAEMHQGALDYFARVSKAVRDQQERQAVRYADDPAERGRPALVSHATVYPQGWPDEPGLFMLRNDYPAAVEFAGDSHASVQHGYWALSAADASDRSRIRDAASGSEAHELGGRAARRSDWPDVRLAVMAGLLRAKFTQHPELAQVLLSTGDARISYTGFEDSPFWRDVPDDRGRNWMGRLLELTRSELLAQQLLLT
ncbi:NADAR family protein [Streptomyces sp. NBC_00523]|uniref:NADAR family protein n=1 Tax=Streptomyces sp. NBC_00523 TaxID=2975765 RepID=UPI002E805D2B|nr:NADAR family protein [Streptomyces sp. NBC_00523]WUC98442.1 NADAR family protein [Streptomyces sp. NBC_00523]